MGLGTALDRAIGVFSPERALRRSYARQQYNRLDARSLDAGRLDRTTKDWGASQQAGDLVDLADIQRSRWRAWDLYKNNKTARKTVRAFVAQVVGNGLTVTPQAINEDGTPNTAFRKAAKRLFELWAKYPMLERPGRGGLTFGGIQQLAAREVCIAGEVFGWQKQRTGIQRVREGRRVRFYLQLLDADRLTEDMPTKPMVTRTGTQVFRGIEVDANDQRISYEFHRHHPADVKLFTGTQDTVKVPAREIVHLYVGDRIGQLRGDSWMSPVVIALKDAGDYEEDELAAAAVAACPALGVVRNSGGPALGINAPTGEQTPVTDLDGNKVTHLQRGLIFDFRNGEGFAEYNPMRPNANVEPFLQHLMRGIAGAIPGLKSSTVTGDYRRASFASERAADNDVWREVQQIQEWMATHWCQPHYEEVLEGGFATGYFDETGVSIEEWRERRDELAAAAWMGPVQKSINPVVDEQASDLRIKSGRSNLIDEAAKMGSNAERNLEAAQQIREKSDEVGLPEEMRDQNISQIKGPARSQLQGVGTQGKDGTPRNGAAASNGAASSNGNGRQTAVNRR